MTEESQHTLHQNKYVCTSCTTRGMLAQNRQQEESQHISHNQRNVSTFYTTSGVLAHLTHRLRPELDYPAGTGTGTRIPVPFNRNWIDIQKIQIRLNRTRTNIKNIRFLPEFRFGYNWNKFCCCLFIRYFYQLSSNHFQSSCNSRFKMIK